MDAYGKRRKRLSVQGTHTWRGPASSDLFSFAFLNERSFDLVPEAEERHFEQSSALAAAGFLTLLAVTSLA
jgi:hypothetical protein